MTDIKPIETVYNGYRFRSRLEARWAVFFDMLGIEYEYEKEGFDFGGTWYLPDFWLPHQKYWIEIKGQEPTWKEIDLLEALVRDEQTRAYLLHGTIPMPPNELSTLSIGYSINCFEYEGKPTFANNHILHPMWTICTHCQFIGMTDLGKTSLLSCGCSQRHHYTENYEYNACDQRLIEAYTAARQARFEHGESGRR